MEERPTSTEIVATVPRYLAGVAILTDIDAVIERSITRILDAKTPEEALADPDAIGVRELVGKVITLTAVVGILPSMIRPEDYYVVLEARMGTPEKVVTITTGSPFAAARAVKCAHEGWLPRRVRVVELESASHPGQASLWFVDVAQADAETGEVPF